MAHRRQRKDIKKLSMEKVLNKYEKEKLSETACPECGELMFVLREKYEGDNEPNFDKCEHDNGL